MKKVLHLYKVYYPTFGGIQNVMRGMITLTADKYKHIVLTTSSEISGFKQYEHEDVYYIKPIMDLLNMPISLKYILEAVRLAKEADIICLHYPFPLADFLLSFIPSDKRIVYFWHSEIVAQKRLFCRLYIKV